MPKYKSIIRDNKRIQSPRNISSNFLHEPPAIDITNNSSIDSTNVNNFLTENTNENSTNIICDNNISEYGEYSTSYYLSSLNSNKSGSNSESYGDFELHDNSEHITDCSDFLAE